MNGYTSNFVQPITFENDPEGDDHRLHDQEDRRAEEARERFGLQAEPSRRRTPSAGGACGKVEAEVVLVIAPRRGRGGRRGSGAHARSKSTASSEKVAEIAEQSSTVHVAGQPSALALQSCHPLAASTA
jgi:hypothetical protein